MVKIRPPIELSRLKEAAASPLCHHDKVFERNPGEYWIETTENLYKLVISTESTVTAAVSEKMPCAEFGDLLNALGATGLIKKGYENEREKETDWDSIAKKYDLNPIKARRLSPKGIARLTPAEEEALRAIQLTAGPDAHEWIDVALVARGFATNLRSTLRSLAKKGLIDVTASGRLARIR